MVPYVHSHRPGITPEVRYESPENDGPCVGTRDCFSWCTTGFLAAGGRPRPLRSAGRLKACGKVSVPQDRRAARQAWKDPGESCRKTAQLAPSGITQTRLSSPMPSYGCAPEIR